MVQLKPKRKKQGRKMKNFNKYIGLAKIHPKITAGVIVAL